MAKNTERKSVGYSTSITIGGKKYNSFEIASQMNTNMKEVHTVTGMEHAPRMVGKELRNEAGIRQTDMSLHQSSSYDYSQRRVQTEAARSSSPSVSSSYERTQPESQYRSQPEYSSAYSSYSQPESNYNYEQRRIHTDNIQTSSQIESFSYERAQSLSQSQSQYKTEDLVYRSSNAESRSNMTEALGYSVNSQATRVQTMESGSGYSYNNRAEQSQSEHSSYYSSYSQPSGNYNHQQKRIHTDNIQTASQMEASSYERVQEHNLSQAQYSTENLIYCSSDVESKSNMTEALGYNVSSQTSRIHTLEPGSSFRESVGQAERSSDQSMRAASYNAPAGYYNHEKNRIHTDNIQTASQREAESQERAMERNLSQSRYNTENLIYHSSDVESRGTMAEALGNEVRYKKGRIMTEEEGGILKERFDNRKARIRGDHLETSAMKKHASVDRVMKQTKSLQGNNVMTSKSMQSMMTQGMQMVGGLKMLDTIDQNRAKDEDESFADSMMPIIKTAIKAGIVVNAVGTISNYTTGSNRSLLHPEEEEKTTGAATGALIGGVAGGLTPSKHLSWYEGKKKGDYIRSFSSKKGTSSRSWGLSDNATVSENSGLFGMLGGEEDGLIGNLSSDNLMVNKWTINTGIQNKVTTGRTIQTAVGAGMGMGGIAAMWNPMAGMWKNSLLKQWNSLKNKITSFFTDPAESLTSSLFDFGKMIGAGALVPILIVVIAFSGGSSAMNIPLLATSSFFGGLFDRDNGDGTTTEINVKEFLENTTYGVPYLRTKYINDLLDEITDLKKPFPFGSGYHIVRLKFDDNTSYTGQTYDEISAVFYSETDLVNMIQPIFNAYILMEYNLQPTQAQARDALKNIFDALIVKESADGATEYCGQDIATGEGTANAVASACGKRHALNTCPNVKTETHTSYTYSCCDSKKCDGHEGECEADCPEDCTIDHPDYTCLGCKFNSCSGHKLCDGHKVKNLHLKLDGIYLLLDKYFYDPIEQLEGLGSPSEADKIKLQTLKDCLEICEEMMKLVFEGFGDLTKAELMAVEMIPGSRPDGDAIIQIALAQVGYAGGNKFWRYMGYTERVEWCACFVSWCMNEVEHGEVRYASCEYGGKPYFQGINQWKDGSYTDLAKGDVIFFDWEGDGVADHTGLVAGKDASYVYTIEGNSGDAVKIKKYQLGASVIHGYGLMHW